MAAKFGLFVDEDHSKLPTLYWLPKLHKRPYKSRFIANSSACTTTELSILLTSCLTAIKNHLLNIAQQFLKEMVKIYFGLLKIQVKFLINCSLEVFEHLACLHMISLLYTTLPHNLIKEKLTELIEQTFNSEGSLYLACCDKNAFFYF